MLLLVERKRLGEKGRERGERGREKRERERSLSSARLRGARFRARRRPRRGCGLIVDGEKAGENYQPRGQSSSFTSDSLRPRADYLALRKADEGN